MTVWVVKGDRDGEYEELALNEKLVDGFPAYGKNAEARIESVVNAYLEGVEPLVGDDIAEDISLESNLEEQIQDRIVAHIRQKFSGSGLERLVAAILEASGYSVLETRPGPDL